MSGLLAVAVAPPAGGQALGEYGTRQSQTECDIAFVASHPRRPIAHAAGVQICNQGIQMLVELVARARTFEWETVIDALAYGLGTPQYNYGAALAEQAKLLADELEKALADPPDRHYKSRARRHRARVIRWKASRGFPRAAAAALTVAGRSMLQAALDTETAMAAYQKAQGAAKAHNRSWERRQLRDTARNYVRVATDLTREHAALAKAIGALTNKVSKTLGADDVAAIQQQLAHRYPAPLTSRMRALHLRRSDMEQIRRGLVAADPASLAGDYPGLPLQTLADALVNASLAFREGSQRLSREAKGQPANSGGGNGSPSPLGNFP